ncbi:MAG: thioredoxin domain-containing protein [Myxococcales bacterium]|nr:thioredoxin domain-containing protein [Myxococcales bacterium]MCB9692882.1 thioredoxin domain-containing protein [Alphaproteobacteria bacterium]
MRSALPALLVLLAACGGQSPPVAPTASAATPGGDPVVATWDGGELKLSEVEAGVQKKLASMESEYLLERYQLLSQALDGAVDDALLEARAKAEGLPDARALLKRDIEDKVSPPTDDDKKAFYEQVKGQLRGAPYEMVEQMLAAELTQRQMAEAYTAYVQDLRAEAHVKGAMPYPDLKKVDIAVSDSDPVLGDRNAPVSIVQFAEYQCYFCNKVNPTVRALVKDYDGKVNLVFKDFPLENHQRARPAAIAARCAGDQERYWEMNALLLANQGALGDADFTRYAEQIGLDGEAFAGCLESGVHDAAVRAAYAQGEAAGVQATPTFYVNGVLVSGAQPYDVFKTVIDQELARK